MIFALFGTVPFLGYILSRSLGLGFFSMGLGYSFCFFSLLLTSHFTKNIALSGQYSTLILYAIGIFIYLFRKNSKTWQISPLVPASALRHWPFAVFLTLLGIYVWHQGAYIEIPSDPVGVHLFRIGEWLREGYIPLGAHDNTFFSGTLMSGYIYSAAMIASSSLDRATSAELLFLLNTLLLTSAFYFVSYFFSRKSHLALITVILAQLTLGTTVYNYFRYYAFAPGLLAMILLLDTIAISSTLKYKKSQFLKFCFLGLFFLVSWLMHKQEAILIGTIVLFTLGYFSVKITSPECFNKFRIVFPFLTFLLFVTAFLAVITNHATQGAHTIPEFNEEFIEFRSIGKFTPLLANPFGPRISATLNLAYLVCLILSFGGIYLQLWARKKESQANAEPDHLWLFSLSLLPLFILFFPPAATLFSVFFYDTVFYRILYFPAVFLAAPLTFDVAQDFFVKKTVSKPPKRSTTANLVFQIVFGGLLICLTFLGNNSRTRHFFLRPVSQESYLEKLPVYEWIKTLKLNRESLIYTDPITAYPMTYLTDLHTSDCKSWRCDFPGSIFWDRPQGVLGTESLAKKYHYFLVNTQTNYSDSNLAAHWPKDIRDWRKYMDAAFPQWVETLAKEGKLIRLGKSAGYILYESTLNPK